MKVGTTGLAKLRQELAGEGAGQEMGALPGHRAAPWSAKFPAHGWVGLAMVLIFWAANWGLPGLRTAWAFFPLWLGLCLTLDGLVYWRKGTSLLARDRNAYAVMFLISAPAWWLFEALNVRTQNWLYDGIQYFSWWQSALLSTLSFSTVMPAVFGAAELAGTFGWVRRLRPGPQVAPTGTTLWLFFAAGWLMLALLLAWPRYCFGFVWGALYLIVEPINTGLGGRTILSSTADRDWQPVIALWIGVLICAFFWEMWNYLSYPKWVYHVPYVGFLHVFEMPLLGYLGYLPFSLELFALYHLVERLFGSHTRRAYVELIGNRE